MRLYVTVLASIAAMFAASVPAVAQSPAAADPMIGAPIVGQCWDYDYAAMMKLTAPDGMVDCSERHTAITVAVVQVPGRMALTGNVDKARAYVFTECTAKYNAALGVSHKLEHITAAVRSIYFAPQNLLDQGARWAQCDLVSPAGRNLVQIADTTPLVSGRPKGEMLLCLDRNHYMTNCTRPHTWEPAGIVTLKSPTVPSEAKQTLMIKAKCGRVVPAGQRYIFRPIGPASWRAGERHVVCWQRR